MKQDNEEGIRIKFEGKTSHKLYNFPYLLRKSRCFFEDELAKPTVSFTIPVYNVNSYLNLD